MRSRGKDIVELFGFAPDDVSSEAVEIFKRSYCPFVSTPCTKTNHDQSVVYGTCAVTAGSDEVIICPKRLYANDFRVFTDVVSEIWGQLPLVVGGTVEALHSKAKRYTECVVAFGQGSGREISISSNGKLSIDWILQRYKLENGRLSPIDFVAIEVQSIDITGNYRETFAAYQQLKYGHPVRLIPDAGHGMNWANVHKRLIPQIIRKGNVYIQMNRCRGFIFILPKLVYEKFDQILGDVPEEQASSRHNLSVFTYSLGRRAGQGAIRPIELDAIKHHSLANIVMAFSSNTQDGAPAELDRALRSLF